MKPAGKGATPRRLREYAIREVRRAVLTRALASFHLSLPRAAWEYWHAAHEARDEQWDVLVEAGIESSDDVLACVTGAP